MESLRQAWESRYRTAPPRAGTRSVRNAFYTDHPKTFPYASLKKFIRSLEWQDGLTYIQNGGKYDYPHDVDFDWMYDMQGVTHDATHWYFSNRYGVWKFPVDYPLEREPDRNTSVGIPDALFQKAIPPAPLIPDHMGWDHFGDIDLYNEDPENDPDGGIVYVPLERDVQDRPPYLVIFDAQLIDTHPERACLGWTQFPASQGTQAPWCAINPLNGLLYTSRFTDSGLFVYCRKLLRDPSTSRVNGIQLEPLGRFNLYDEAGQTLEIGGIQGGAFSANGHLYLVCDHYKIANPWFDPDPTAWPPQRETIEIGGIVAFDMMTGRRKFFQEILYERTGDAVVTSYRNQELEGLTLWDLDDGRAPNVRGQIHVVMQETTDDFYFKHFRHQGPL